MLVVFEEESGALKREGRMIAETIILIQVRDNEEAVEPFTQEGVLRLLTESICGFNTDDDDNDSSKEWLLSIILQSLCVSWLFVLACADRSTRALNFEVGILGSGTRLKVQGFFCLANNSGKWIVLIQTMVQRR
jgi:hypothetical protein